MSKFCLQSPFTPQGDQPQAIEALVEGLSDPLGRLVLRGVTGSGKTYTVAKVAEQLQVPLLVIAPNKTLAGQLHSEFRDFFPDNAVEYFVSYYDYYQPEAYLASSDTYIEKDARINEQIDRMRNRATASLLERRDVIVVASVSCIYGLGDPATYRGLALDLEVGQTLSRLDLMRGLVRTQYGRAETNFRPGSFRSRGPAVEIWPVHEESKLVSVELDGDHIAHLLECDSLTGEILTEPSAVRIWPVGHYVQPGERLQRALVSIASELEDRTRQLLAQGRELEAERLQRRVLADLEEMKESGHCPGVENYSRHLEGRSPGQAPFTLLHYFPKDFLCVIDESHVSLPQVGGMLRGDQSRKKNLVEHGFRLPSAVDNRPLSGSEFESLLGRILCLSATPGPRELELADGAVVEQVVRPTGLLDPECEVKPARAQVEDALAEARSVVQKGGRVLVTALTKRGAEDLTEFFQEQGLAARYLHADIDTLQRAVHLRDLRLGVFDVLVGINLLREGLDLPEVSLVLVLDADREGFLRSGTSLIQICGRASRNVAGRVIFYADKRTAALQQALDEADRRRKIQSAFNKKHGILPQTVCKAIAGPLHEGEGSADVGEILGTNEIMASMEDLRLQMLAAAQDLKFEEAIAFRDQIRRLETLHLEVG